MSLRVKSWYPIPRPVIGCAFSAIPNAASARAVVFLDRPRTFLEPVPVCSPRTASTNLAACSRLIFSITHLPHRGRRCVPGCEYQSRRRPSTVGHRRRAGTGEGTSRPPTAGAGELSSRESREGIVPLDVEIGEAALLALSR